MSKTTPKTRTLDIDQLLQNLAEVLGQSDGEYVAEICNRVMVQKISYIGDGLFEVEG
jgi:hypothetical protein